MNEIIYNSEIICMFFSSSQALSSSDFYKDTSWNEFKNDNKKYTSKMHYFFNLNNMELTKGRVELTAA